MTHTGLAHRVHLYGPKLQDFISMSDLTPRSVLVVDSDPADLSDTVRLLQSAGYRVASASAFDQAKEILANDSPDLLITGLRLGPYNGLHLVLRSQADHPGMAAIVTSRVRDAVLEAEALRHKAAYLLRPLADGEFLEAIMRSLTIPAADALQGGTQVGDFTT
jgi:DNA-binding NtrC family response regulator